MTQIGCAALALNCDDDDDVAAIQSQIQISPARWLLKSASTQIVISFFSSLLFSSLFASERARARPLTATCSNHIARALNSGSAIIKPQRVERETHTHTHSYEQLN